MLTAPRGSSFSRRLRDKSKLKLKKSERKEKEKNGRRKGLTFHKVAGDRNGSRRESCRKMEIL